MAQDGSQFATRRIAIRYMVQEGSYSEQELEKMRSGLANDNWQESPLLPPSWRFKTIKDGTKTGTGYKCKYNGKFIYNCIQI